MSNWLRRQCREVPDETDVDEPAVTRPIGSADGGQHGAVDLEPDPNRLIHAAINAARAVKKGF
jgi:hypothetical protein